MIFEDQIAFFWVGETVATPTLLVKSIQHVYGKKNPVIYHLTNETTPEIDGVTKTIRNNLSKHIMVARLESYSYFPFNNKQTFFCDADSLILNRLRLSELNENLYLTIRNENSLINPEGYPEFENKTFLEMMPFLFGAMALKDGKQFFENLIAICKDLPSRFHRWYGDQYSLKLYYDQTKFSYQRLDIDKYLYITKKEIDVYSLIKLIQKDVKIITFKGRGSKKYILETIKNLLRINLN